MIHYTRPVALWTKGIFCKEPRAVFCPTQAWREADSVKKRWQKNYDVWQERMMSGRFGMMSPI